MSSVGKKRTGQASRAEQPSEELPPARRTAIALWAACLLSFALAGANVLGRNPLALDRPAPKSEDPPATTASGAPLKPDPFLSTPEDRAALSYFCGPRALSRALGEIAKTQGIEGVYDEAKAYARAVELSIPQPGRGASLLDLQRAARKIGPVEATGIRFDSGKALADLLAARPIGTAAIVHLNSGAPLAPGEAIDPNTPVGAPPVACASPPADTSSGQSGHFIAVVRATASSTRFLYFDPLEASALRGVDGAEARGRELDVAILAPWLDQASSGKALLLVSKR